MSTKPPFPTAMWKHQREAIDEMRAYLVDKPSHEDAALLTLPTGTGKSGVIAWALARLPELEGHRLVLTPWAGLRDQLIDDIGERFWDRVGKKGPPKEMPSVKRLPPTKEIASIGDDEPTIFVATTSAITKIVRKIEGEGGSVANAFAGFDCVVVDEGHYEPAQEWSKAIRALSLPTILLTATPYRNDLKSFEISETHRYRFTHQAAEAGLFLRTPEFATIEVDDVAGFASQVRDLVDQEFADTSVRAIIRCSEPGTIGQMVTALQGLGETAVGIHETFTKGHGDSFVSSVREAVKNHSGDRFWVHQHKLIEGVDDPSFKAVAFFNSPRSGRAIVQQIGRALRNPSQDSDDAKALVVGRGDRDLERVWESYLLFDQDEAAASVATTKDLLGTLIKGQPQAIYFDRDFRTQIDLESSSAWETFSYPLRVRVFRVRNGHVLDIDSAVAAIENEWKDDDRSVYRVQRPDLRTAVIPYLCADNSHLLRTAIFIEPKFGYTMLRIADDLVFVYDARGSVPDCVKQTCKRLSAGELRRLFPEGASGLTSVALTNTDMGRHAARRRQLAAAAIEELAPDLGDYGYICTVAVGHVLEGETKRRRYVGLSRARLTDYRPSEGDYGTFTAWLDQVEADIRTEGGQALATFDRYASAVDAPDETEPVHVLLDIDQSRFVKKVGEEEVPLEFEDTAQEVKDGCFEVEIDGATRSVEIAWEADRGAYRLRSSEVQSVGYGERDLPRRGLIQTINEDQLLRIVPAQSGFVYSHGEWIAPSGTQAASRILPLLQGIDRLKTIGDEKGKTSNGNDWDPESVFGLISGLATTTSNNPAEPEMTKILGEPTLMVCTDLGTEVADFVALNDDLVVFIHAKASTKASFASAKALQIVVTQAIKNLLYLQPFEQKTPPLGQWTTPWKAEDEGEIDRRRAGDYKTADEAWKQIRAVVSNPQANREVWIVMGQSLSVDKLKKELGKKKKPISPEALQIFALLQTAWAATAQVGARLRIFCSP